MKITSLRDYLNSKYYISYLYKRVKNGGALNVYTKLLKKVRKFTIISKVFDIALLVISIIEKSAILLIITSVFLLVAPIVLFIILLVSTLRIIVFNHWHKFLFDWLENAERIVVYITSEKVIKKNSLVLRDAKEEADWYSFPVIIVTADRFFAAHWVAFNLLAVKLDYFFALQNKFFSKNKQKIIYVVLS